MCAVWFNELLSHHFICEMQNERYQIFKSQDLEKGKFDVVFEVEGKKLYAIKFMLTSVSETMASMLSDRWLNKDEVVKIQTYSYDNFYQFLCFLYTGKCELTYENVFELVDMAEFYGVSSFKKYCDKEIVIMAKYGGEYGKKFLTVENVKEMMEFANNYSLEQYGYSLREFCGSRQIYMFECAEFQKKYTKDNIDSLKICHCNSSKHQYFECPMTHGLTSSIKVQHNPHRLEKNNDVQNANEIETNGIFSNYKRDENVSVEISNISIGNGTSIDIEFESEYLNFVRAKLDSVRETYGLKDLKIGTNGRRFTFKAVSKDNISAEKCRSLLVIKKEFIHLSEDALNKLVGGKAPHIKKIISDADLIDIEEHGIGKIVLVGNKKAIDDAKKMIFDCCK
uniref:BTB domain-containing protein n=1 Tax=Panagrolaimus davidi TaxID=227884 RepID=A0A914QKJ5_9BILA